MFHPIYNWNIYPRESSWRRSHNSSTSTISRGGDTEEWLFGTEIVALMAGCTTSSLKGTFLPWESMEEVGSSICFYLFLEFLREILIGEEGSIIGSTSWPLPLKNKGLSWLKSLPLPCEVFCSLAWVFLLNGGKHPARIPLPWPLLLPFYYFGDLTLDLNMFPYH